MSQRPLFVPYASLTEAERDIADVVVRMTQAAADAAPTQNRLRFGGREKVIVALLRGMDGVTAAQRIKLTRYFTVS